MVEISTIIPTYNDSDTLPRAINSALNQTYSPEEIIVVDDASEDNLTQALRKYSDDEIKVITHKYNMGGSAARNTGIKASSGNYLAFLDADDEWLPKKLELQMNMIEQSGLHDAVCCARRFDLDHMKKLKKNVSDLLENNGETIKNKSNSELIRMILSRNFSVGTSSIMIEREFMNELGGFDPEFPRHQDHELLIRILQQGSMTYVDNELVIKHPTGRPSADTYAEAKRLLLSKFEQEVEKFENDGYEITEKQMFELSRLYIEERKYKEALNLLPRYRPDRLEIAQMASSLLKSLSSIV